MRGAIGLRFGPHFAAFSVGYVIFSYASVPGVVTREFGVGFTAVGLLMSAALASFVVVQAIGGRLVNDRPTLPVLLGLAAVNAVLAVALDLAPSFAALLALRALWGLVGGLVVTVCATHVSRVYDGPTATLHQSLNGGMFTLGGALAFALAPRIVAVTGWFGVHATGALVGAPAVAAMWFDRGRAGRTGPRFRARRADEAPSTDRFATLRNRVVLLAAACNAATLGAYITLSTFVTAYFVDVGVGGPLNVLALLVASIGRMSGGVASVRSVGRGGEAIAAASGVGAVGLFALAVGDGFLLLFLPILALAAVSFPFGAIFERTAAASTRDATAVAIVVAAGNGAALVLPAITGWLRDATGDYDAAFFLLALCTLGAAAAGVAIARRTEPDRNH